MAMISYHCKLGSHRRCTSAACGCETGQHLTGHHEPPPRDDRPHLTVVDAETDDDAIRRTVDQWFPLTDWQRERLSLLLHPGERGRT